MTDVVVLGLKLFGLRDELFRAKELTENGIKDLERILPELLAIGHRIEAELFPQASQDRTVASFDVFWVQRALNELGQKLKVDGNLGPVTRKAVKEFQTNRLIVPDDGVPGRATCVALYNAIQKGALR